MRQFGELFSKAIMFAFVLFVSACGGGGSGTDSNPQVGNLEVGIQGLSFKSGSNKGLTTATGYFTFKKDGKIQFSVGDFLVGNETAGAANIKLEDLFVSGKTDSKYIKTLQILNVLDADLDSANGIEIDQLTVLSVKKELIALDLNSANFETQYAALVAKLKYVSNANVKTLSTTDAIVGYQKLLIQTLLNEKIRTYDLPGIQLSIELPNSEIWHTSAGEANKESHTKMTNEHVLRIGSATKSFVALLIMQLVDEGKLSLTQTVEEFFPGKFPHGSEMTVKMLLNHTAGIFSFTNEFPGYDQVFNITSTKPMEELWFYRYLGHSTFEYSNDSLVQIAIDAANGFVPTEAKPYLMNEPGTAWNYSNTHYVMLSQIAEQITGTTWESEVEARFITKLGLTHTTIPKNGEAEMKGLFASGYINWVESQGAEAASIFGYPDSDLDRTSNDPSYTGGSGNMVSTTSDLLIWARAVMKGELLSAAGQAKLLDPFRVEAFGSAIEMELGVVHDLKYKYFGHRGQMAGYDAAWQFFYTDINDVAGTGRPCAIVINRTLHLLDGEHTNGSALVLNDVLKILYGEDAVAEKHTTSNKTKKTKYLPFSEY
jgi:D-alanyl-D-alanine carboxypeptidase